jgi:hypothetical protein
MYVFLYAGSVDFDVFPYDTYGNLATRDQIDNINGEDRYHRTDYVANDTTNWLAARPSNGHRFIQDIIIGILVEWSLSEVAATAVFAVVAPGLHLAQHYRP